MGTPSRIGRRRSGSTGTIIPGPPEKGARRGYGTELPPGSGSRARSHALIEESPLHRVAGEGESILEVAAGGVPPPEAKLELADRGGIERIALEAVPVIDRSDLLEA